MSVYHLLVENNVVEQARACLISAPGGCATKWIDEFGYVTIPTLALTGFALCFAFLLLGALPAPSATVSRAMTSGKKARRKRQTVNRPPVRSTGGRKASPKVLAIVAIAIALAVVIGVIVFVVAGRVRLLRSSNLTTTTGARARSRTQPPSSRALKGSRSTGTCSARRRRR